jgi:hypothetical protein
MWAPRGPFLGNTPALTNVSFNQACSSSPKVRCGARIRCPWHHVGLAPPRYPVATALASVFRHLKKRNRKDMEFCCLKIAISWDVTQHRFVDMYQQKQKDSPKLRYRSVKLNGVNKRLGRVCSSSASIWKVEGSNFYPVTGFPNRNFFCFT